MKRKSNIPRYPLPKEARDFLANKVKHMKGIEKEKTIERLEKYDRGFKKKDYYKKDREKAPFGMSEPEHSGSESCYYNKRG